MIDGLIFSTIIASLSVCRLLVHLCRNLACKIHLYLEVEHNLTILYLSEKVDRIFVNRKATVCNDLHPFEIQQLERVMKTNPSDF